jgi:hypothetical protein
MLQSLEAIVDDQGSIHLLEAITLTASRRAIVTILPDELKSEFHQQTPQTSEIEVHFLHHRYPRTFTALIHMGCTGEQALKGLLIGDKNGPFLDSPIDQPYELVVAHTQQVIMPYMTFAQVGVRQGDTIEVRQAGRGAGYSYSEIAELVVSSGLSLAFLKAVTSVITQLLKSREKTLEYEKNGEKYKLTASSSIKEMIEAVKALRGRMDEIPIQAPNQQVTITELSKSDSRKRAIPLQRDENRKAKSISTSASSKKFSKKQNKVRKKTSAKGKK